MPASSGQSQGSSSEGAAKAEENTDNAPPSRREALPKRIWAASGLNIGMLCMMAKGALPPVISLAIYQSTSVARVYSTLGYLVAIMSVISFAILPRAKFIQTMLFNIIGVCIGAALALLAIYCSVQARSHTTPRPQSTSGGPSPGTALSGYNSSASAVSAIWLFFNIYLANTIRASRPQLQFPVIMYSIFANVASTYAPSFPTMASGIAFTKRLMEAFFTGFGIATGVSLFVFPVTVRKTIFKQSAGFIGAVQGALKAQISYLQSLEKEDTFRPAPSTEDEAKEGKKHHQSRARPPKSIASLETQKLKAAIAVLADLYGKMHTDLSFAKREVAWGKLNASEIEELFKLFQDVMLPLLGMSSASDIFQRIADKWGWMEPRKDKSALSFSKEDHSQEAIAQWNAIMKTLHDPFQTMIENMHDGLQHALYTLEFAKTPKGKRKDKTETSKDVEADAGIVKPGDAGYGTFLGKKIDEFYETRKSTLALFVQEKSGAIDPSPLEHPRETYLNIHKNAESSQHDPDAQKRNKRQLYLVLYMEFLLWSTGKAVLNLVKFADRKVEEGVMKKNRLIHPGGRRLKKWVKRALQAEDADSEHAPDSIEGGGVGVYAGASFEATKDPEHLPPTNAWQRFGNGLRAISEILGSQESVFGFRVACATLSIGIVAYLEATHVFFLEQRLVWAMIMVAIGMTVTAGSGVFGFIGRVAGTAIAMCTSIIVWYIVDGHVAGVLVFMFIFIFMEFYFLMKYPRFVVIALISIVSQVLIVGYELEVKKVGAKVATSNGQPYYAIYLLAPYRLACVSGGMLVAFIWTFFPYPLTARSQLRKDLGASLYLLANYYSIVHTTVGIRLKGAEGDMASKQSPGRKLAKARTQVFTRELALLAGLRQHSTFTAWEPSFGGKFPKQQYDVIIQETQNILNYIALVSYSSQIFSHSSTESPARAAWIEDFSRVVGSLQVTSHDLTSTLSLLSAAVTNGNPLPPYLKGPKPFQLSAKLEALDADILSVKHITEPGYSAFAVMQIASSLISDDLGKLIENVKALVGEVDFSFHAISTSQDSEEALLLGDQNKGKKD